jgi:flavin-binding protein dodecin
MGPPKHRTSPEKNSRHEAFQAIISVNLREGARLMITKILLAGLAASTLAMAYSGDSFAAKFEAMPHAAQETAAANMENALPMSITSTKGEHGMEYQVNTRLNGETHNLVIDEKGKLLAVKDGTDLASVPAAVKTAIEKESSSLQIVTLEKVTEDGGLVSYGAVMKDDADGKFVHVRVATDGTLKSKNRQDTR